MTVASWDSRCPSFSADLGEFLVQLKVLLPRTLRRAAVTAVVAAAFAAPAWAAGDPPIDHPAVAAKRLQTDLMVAALYCNERQRYNDFVRRFEPQIAAQGNDLKALFRRSHGNNGTTALNAAVTRMANEASERTMADPTGFCTEHGQLFDDVLAVNPREFSSFIAAVKDRPLQPNRGVAAVSAPVPTVVAAPIPAPRAAARPASAPAPAARK